MLVGRREVGGSVREIPNHQVNDITDDVRAGALGQAVAPARLGWRWRRRAELERRVRSEDLTNDVRMDIEERVERPTRECRRPERDAVRVQLEDALPADDVSAGLEIDRGLRARPGQQTEGLELARRGPISR